MLVESHDLAIQNCGLCLNMLGQNLQLAILRGQVVVIARDEANAAVFNK